MDGKSYVWILKKKGSRRCRRLKGHLLPVKHKLDWGQRLILLLPQAAVRPGSDAGSINFCCPKPPDIVFYVVPEELFTLLECGLRFVQRRRTRNLVKERERRVE